MLFLTYGLFAAPLESGYALAPRSNASPDERARAYITARNRVIEASRQYLGAPYLYAGMSRNGMDCSGLICASFRDALGVTLPRSASGLYTWAERISLDRAQPGDLLFFRTANNNNITHVALYLGNRRFIHSASAGAVTGVIYSSLDEQYWSNAFAGAGRAFPEVPAGSVFEGIAAADVPGGQGGGAQGGQGGGAQGGGAGGGTQPGWTQPGRTQPQPASEGTQILAGAAFAPILNIFLPDISIIRGFSSYLFFEVKPDFLDSQMTFGLELRPEYDGALGVFRLPITLSWGPNAQIKFFAGPVLSFGDAVITINGVERRYSGGTSWLGIAGITVMSNPYRSPIGLFSPYFEAAWQFYYNEDMEFDLAADFSAGFRFTTGIRWALQLN